MGILNKIKKYQTGVTLMEMLVAVTIFSVAILAAISIFMFVVTSQKMAIASQNVQESLRYVLELFSKEIRTALPNPHDSSCGSGTNLIYNQSSGSELYFVNQDSECVRYYLSSGALMIERGGATATATPSTVTVNSMSFNITDQENYISQPMVGINIEAVYTNARAQYNQAVRIQTAITSRSYE